MDIEKLKQKVLDLAIRGKLVPQDPNDEPATVLIEKIKAEKAKLIKEGKIKASKEESYIYKGSDNCYYEKIGNTTKNITEDIPFEIPDNWCFARMQSVLDVRDGTHDSPKYYDVGIPFVTSKNLKNNSIDFSTCKLISPDDAKKFNQRSCVDNFDILFAMIGTIGNPTIVEKDRDFSIKNVALFKNINRNLLSEKWIKIVLESLTSRMIEKASSGLQPFVSLDFLRNYIIPIPPIPEQNKILKLIDDIMEYCIKIGKDLQTVYDLSNLAKIKILDDIFGENSSYKSYYKKCSITNDVIILDKLRKPVNKTERSNKLLNAKITYPYYGATGKAGEIDDYIIDDEVVLLGEDGAPFLDKFSAKAYMVSGKIWVNNHVHILKSKTNNKFLLYYLNWIDYSKYVSGTTRLKLSQENFFKIPFIDCDTSIKNAIVSKIDEIFSTINKIKEQII